MGKEEGDLEDELNLTFLPCFFAFLPGNQERGTLILPREETPMEQPLEGCEGFLDLEVVREKGRAVLLGLGEKKMRLGVR